ncbi:MAG: hypothetical protein GF313_11125 [Caldithrix sp.]|nr:hypothetical protein [Caldithrix sp.]
MKTSTVLITFLYLNILLSVTVNAQYVDCANELHTGQNDYMPDYLKNTALPLTDPTITDNMSIIGRLPYGIQPDNLIYRDKTCCFMPWTI